MTLSELVKIIDGKTNIVSDENINEIKTDTRKINPKDVFIALKGKKYDGIKYACEAIKKGAIACIVESDVVSKSIIVKDTYDSLFKIGNYIRNKYNIPLIAITGSNGKTTTKDILSHILKEKYNVLKNSGNKNNIVGVFETLLNLKDDVDIIVMELGTNHLGEISRLSNMCNPTKAIITNIGSSHLEYFKKRKNIFKEKLSVIDGMNNKDLIVNGDDKYLKKLKYFKCGTKNNNDLKAYNIKSHINYTTFNIYLDKEYLVRFNNPGVHFVYDILLSIKVALDYNIDINDIIKKVETFKITEKRMSLLECDDNIVIDDCYNASLESIKAGFNYLKGINNKKIIILGDMLELGKYSKKMHKKVNKCIKNIDNKVVLTVGNFTKYIKGIHFNNSIDLIKYLENNEIHNSYIYIKGSRKMNLDIVVDYFKNKVKKKELLK